MLDAEPFASREPVVVRRPSKRQAATVHGPAMSKISAALSRRAGT